MILVALWGWWRSHLDFLFQVNVWCGEEKVTCSEDTYPCSFQMLMFRSGVKLQCVLLIWRTLKFVLFWFTHLLLGLPPATVLEQPTSMFFSLHLSNLSRNRDLVLFSKIFLQRGKFIPFCKSSVILLAFFLCQGMRTCKSTAACYYTMFTLVRI